MKSLQVTTVLLSVLLAGCGKTSASFSETVLCPYTKDGNGGFSPFWAAYLIYPPEHTTNQPVWVSLNGKRLGPYSGVSGMLEVSQDGRHLAFAAKKDAQWVVVVDGVEKYCHKGLLWPWSAWSPSLEGNQYIPQTRAAVLEFSPDGKSLAYPAAMEDGKYAMYVNGKPGPAYPGVGAEVQFVAGKPLYYAFPQDKKIVEVCGEQVLGPYDSSYTTKVSRNGQHYCFWAEDGNKNIFVVDGTTAEVPGKISTYAIGDDGVAVFAYKANDKYHVRVGKTDLTNEYEDVAELTPSPDNKKVAFWALKDGQWIFVVGDKVLAGFQGYFYYDCGGRKYSVMWTPDSQHVAYYARDGYNGRLILDGQKLENPFRPPGLALQVIRDENGQTVGSGMMNGPSTDPEAFAQAVVLRDKIKCDPFSASLFGSTLCYVETNSTSALMHVGETTQGPYKSIKSRLATSEDGKDYAYVVETDKGQQLVVNGKVAPHAYDAIYRINFNEGDKAIDALAVRDGNLIHVVQPLSAE